MHMLCSKFSLMKGMKAILPIALSSVRNKNTLDILSNFMFKASTNNTVELVATNLEETIKYYIYDSKVIENGQIILPAKKFIDIIKTILDTDKIDIAINNGKSIDIKTNTSTFNLLGISGATYPNIVDFPSKDTLSINKTCFINALKKTMFSMEKESKRSILNSTYLIVRHNVLELVTTDAK
ncbi:MAG: hypothetical protein LBM05_01425, partial [Endomicrobium sp.]|nr:hypothetical protein [Endomicrobium sp.]